MGYNIEAMPQVQGNQQPTPTGYSQQCARLFRISISRPSKCTVVLIESELSKGKSRANEPIQLECSFHTMNLPSRLHASVDSFSGYHGYNKNFEDNNSGLQITTVYDQDFTEQRSETPEHQNPPNPILLLNDQPLRMSKFDAVLPLQVELDGLSPNDLNPDGLCRDKDYANLRGLLRACQISHMDKVNEFWPNQLLRRILTRERVEEELLRIQDEEEDDQNLWGHGVQWYLEKLFPDDSQDFDTDNGAENGIEFEASNETPCGTNYLRVYAILVLCENQPSIRAFMETGISDNDLPFVKCNNGSLKLTLARRRHPSLAISCFRKWRECEIEQFYDFQYQVSIPYFCLASSTNAPIKYVKYLDRTILPWIQDMDKSEYGGYGEISCMRIHPASHGFQHLAQVRVGEGMFALKRMTSKDVKDFKNETEMLRMFSGHHEHLIMLLISFSHRGKDYLLFPWADCDLGKYWKNENNKPPYDPTTGHMYTKSMEWVSRQILGLASGLNEIHNPTHLHDRSDMRYGRHGDLKPENILWLKSMEDPNGILVIGDLGISAIHREISRSNQPGKDIPHSPDYRPPECDLKGGTISRAFDIWTLGCLFLEMICWTLGGMKLVEAFETDRANVMYLGLNSCTNIFFHIQERKVGGYVIHVKDEVLQVRTLLYTTSL
jgi:serine/threonine protein kinase